MQNQSFEGSQLSIEEVKDRWDVKETPTSNPKKVRGAYIDWRNSCYHGALLTKTNLKKLKKWREYQIEHFDDAVKDEVK